jgi:LacI family transcriptional regulator
MATMKEIARAAHVSQPTVSLVLNNKASSVRISDKTRAKVQAVAEELGYRRNEVARSMKTGKTNTIGFISTLPTSYTMEIVAGITNILNANGYLLKIFMPDTPSRETILETATKFVEQRLDGIICHTLPDQLYGEIHDELASQGIPLIAVDSDHPFGHCISIQTDDRDGARMATEHLIGLGHRRIGMLLLDTPLHYTQSRLAGYRDALQAAGIPSDPDLLCQAQFPFILTQEQDDCIIAFLEASKPTAVFCASDPLAMKLLQVAYKHGIKIPEDLSIVGFGGLDYSAIASPALTTVDQPFRKMGEAAAQKIMTLAETGHLPKSEHKTLITLTLLKRDSAVSFTSRHQYQKEGTQG